MPTSISLGFSQLLDPPKAVLQACVQVKNQLNTSHTDLIIIFATPEYITAETQDIIARSLKPKHLIGSSTCGIILSNGVANRGFALAGINSDDMSFGVSAVSDLDAQDKYSAGFDLARRVAQDLNEFRRDVFITFSAGIEKNSSQFIRGIKEVLGGVFPVLGAISSNDFKHKGLFQFYQDQILQNAAVGLLLGGASHLAMGCKHGFKPLGKPRTITKVNGTTIHTIDDGPAIDIYKHFLGDQADELKDVTLNSYAAMYPLGFYMEESRQYLLRNIIDILPDGSIVCHEGVPQGAEVHLMISNKESCLNSASEAAGLVKASLGDRQAKLVLIFESFARHKILGRSAFAEIQAIKEVLGYTTPIIGMCSFGEIGPFGTSSHIKNIYLQNETILMVAIS